MDIGRYLKYHLAKTACFQTIGTVQFQLSHVIKNHARFDPEAHIAPYIITDYRRTYTITLRVLFS